MLLPSCPFPIVKLAGSPDIANDYLTSRTVIAKLINVSGSVEPQKLAIDAHHPRYEDCHFFTDHALWRNPLTISDLTDGSAGLHGTRSVRVSVLGVLEAKGLHDSD